MLAQSFGDNRHFYPRSPCGERQSKKLRMMKCKLFLSTLSLRRATTEIIKKLKLFGYFYPRSPCGERHLTNYHFSGVTEISIHALLAESDFEYYHQA